MKTISRLSTLLSLLILSNCAIVHHVQVGEVDSKTVLKGRRFEVKVNEVGFNLEEASKIGQSMTRHKGTRDAIGSVQAIISLFQMGPRTGNQVFTPKYADRLFSLLKKECPSGRISGVTSIRETAKYPVISGEIVKIIGYCRHSKRG